MMMKRIVLCADDYGQGLAISKAILHLIEKNRLSAVSCLATSPEWPSHAGWLKSCQGRVDIGLHFNLTDGTPLSEAYRKVHGSHFFSLSDVLRKAFLHRFDRQVIAAECRAQLEAFKTAMGRLPDFLDGHQHVHQFPVVREAVLSVYQAYYPEKTAYMRLVDHRIGMANIKKMIIYLSGTRAFRQLLDESHIPHNTSFSGVYGFRQSTNYSLFFQQFIKEIQDGGLIMCHPGLKPVDAKDPIGEARYAEYQYFASEQFLRDCADRHIQIKPY